MSAGALQSHHAVDVCREAVDGGHWGNGEIIKLGQTQIRKSSNKVQSETGKSTNQGRLRQGNHQIKLKGKRRNLHIKANLNKEIIK